MTDKADFEHIQPSYPAQGLTDVYRQWESPTLTDSTSNPHGQGAQINDRRAVPIVPSQAQQALRDQLPSITNPQDLYLLQERIMSTASALPAEPGRLDEVKLPTANNAPEQLPQHELPGLLFGSDFQWNFNPTSNDAANIWSQMPAYSWLDTSDGWDVMLRPESPNPTEGNLSVDPQAIQYIPKSASVVSNDMDEYVEENGRRYHKYHEGEYLLPNDEKEQDRLDFQHTIATMVLHGELNLAPIGSPKNVLDIATGTGIWAIQFAQKHPGAAVMGTDLSPIQPDAKPDNCRFWVADAEDPWHFEVPFDYIHARAVCLCFDDPRRVIQQAFDNLEPGGWLELQDAGLPFQSDDGTLDGTAVAQVFQLIVDGALSAGRDVKVAEHYKQWMTEIGFEEVRERKFKVPGNTWPKDPYAKQIGLYEAANVRDAIDGVSKAALRRGLDITEEERAALAEQARFDATNPDIHYYVKLYVVYGRKPYRSSTVPDVATTLAGVGAFC